MVGTGYKTTEDFINAYYGREIQQAGLVAGTTGAANPVFGKKAYTLLNQEANIFGVIPKRQWQHGGYRILTQLFTSAGAAADSPVAIPAPTLPTITEVTTAPKSHVLTTEESMLKAAVRESQDDEWGGAQLIASMAESFKQQVDTQMGQDFNTLITNGFESIDRVCASSVERAACGEGTNDEDIYGIDRSANTATDAQVVHNSNTTEDLETSHFTHIMKLTLDKGANAKGQYWLMSPEQYENATDLMNDQFRYVGIESHSATQGDGVQTGQGMAGNKFGGLVAYLFGRPCYVAQNVLSDRFYLLDSSLDGVTNEPRLSIDLLAPPTVLASQDPVALGNLSTEYVFYMFGELVCRNLAVQGKVRDLNEVS